MTTPSREEAPERAGWAYFSEDAGYEWSANHPIESGEVPDATDIERMTYDRFMTESGALDCYDADDNKSDSSIPDGWLADGSWAP